MVKNYSEIVFDLVNDKIRKTGKKPDTLYIPASEESSFNKYLDSFHYLKIRTKKNQQFAGLNLRIEGEELKVQ